MNALGRPATFLRLPDIGAQFGSLDDAFSELFDLDAAFVRHLTNLPPFCNRRLLDLEGVGQKRLVAEVCDCSIECFHKRII